MATYFKERKTWLLHLSFWCAYASFFFYYIAFRRGEMLSDWGRIITDLSFQVITMMIICYLNYFYFLPRFLKRKNIGRYILEFLPLLLIFSYLVVQGKQFILELFDIRLSFLYSSRFYITFTLNTLFLVVFIGLLRFVEDWFELEARRKELENERLSSELRFLRTQIHPHFLFNTLNNLYYLAYTNSPNTTEVIAKLSQMMRYMIHDSNHSRVPLEKEIEYIENYIKLEKLRLDDSIPIDLTIQGDPTGKNIAPLILITFLENAFKHGVSNSAQHCWIKVDLDIQEKGLVYRVDNSKIQESNKNFKEASGIGLKNVRRRLKLSYPEQYSLDINDGAERFSVVLKLDQV